MEQKMQFDERFFTQEDAILANEITRYLRSRSRPEYSLWKWALKVPIMDRMSELLKVSPDLSSRFSHRRTSDPSSSVLDLGCGFCVYWPFLSRVGYDKFAGIDLYSERGLGEQEYMKTAHEIVKRFCNDGVKFIILEDDVRNIDSRIHEIDEEIGVRNFDLVFAKNVDYKKLGSTGIPIGLCDRICETYLNEGGIKAYAG
jgi:hypothetical protein